MTALPYKICKYFSAASHGGWWPNTHIKESLLSCLASLISFLIFTLTAVRAWQILSNSFGLLNSWTYFEINMNCVKSVQIRSYFWSVFLVRIWTLFTQCMTSKEYGRVSASSIYWYDIPVFLSFSLIFRSNKWFWCISNIY